MDIENWRLKSVEDQAPDQLVRLTLRKFRGAELITCDIPYDVIEQLSEVLVRPIARNVKALAKLEGQE